MDEKKTILITGATGLVGSLLTLTALRSGHSVRLLSRGKQACSPEERIRKVVEVFGCSSKEWSDRHGNIEIYSGDIALPQFGLSDREWEQLASSLSSIYHAAAFIGFKENQRPTSFRVNVEGTRQVLRLAATSRAHLFHISTAYIAGDTHHLLPEQEIKRACRWRNPYEETKWIAEREVHAESRKKGLKLTVFRPAILIGDTTGGRTIRFNSIYYFMRLFHHQSRQANPPPLVLRAKPEATLNLVPVDLAIRTMWALSQSSGVEGKVFHIAHPSPLRFKDLVSIAEKIFGLPVAISNHPPGETTIPKETGPDREAVFGIYEPYMFGESEFDLSNTRSLLPGYDSIFPRLDEGYFRTILTYAIDHDWRSPSLSDPSSRKKRAPRLMEQYFRTFLGTRLNQPLLKNLKNLNVVFSIEIEDGQDSKWTLEVRGGKLLSITQNGIATEFRYRMDGATFEKIVKGLCPPEEAFFEGWVQIEGDIEKGLEVATVLSEFCRTYPFEERTWPG